MRVLIAEDFVPMREALEEGLNAAGYAVDAVDNGKDAWMLARRGEYDIILLDIMMPEMTGLEVLSKIRAAKFTTPVLILTARDEIDDRVTGLDLGADDYMIKPFAFEELLARIRATVRRNHNQCTNTITCSDLVLDAEAKSAKRGERVLDLTAKEYAVLESLVMKQGRILTQDDLRDSLYDYDSDAFSNVIEVFIARLRKKLEADGEPRLIHTKRGMGYVLEQREE